MRALAISVWLCSSVFLFSLAATAQSGGGVITGVVSDADRAVVPNATIQAKNVATGAIYKAVTSSIGNYTLSRLPAGNYELSVTAPGFKPHEQRAIALQTGQTLRIGVRLEDGA